MSGTTSASTSTSTVPPSSTFPLFNRLWAQRFNHSIRTSSSFIVFNLHLACVQVCKLYCLQVFKCSKVIVFKCSSVQIHRVQVFKFIVFKCSTFILFKCSTCSSTVLTLIPHGNGLGHQCVLWRLDRVRPAAKLAHCTI